MKKYFMFAAVVTAGMLASCSSESLTGSDPESPTPAQEELVPIQIGVSNNLSAKLQTRGAGTVGDIEDGTTSAEESHWQGEKVNIYMFEKGTLNLAKDGENNTIYDHTLLTTPNTGVSTGIAQEITVAGLIKHKYYPVTGNYDFWGYYADDAATADPTINGQTDVTVPFKINGTQDLMVAKAVPTADQATIIGGWTEPERFYSAFAARKDIQPEMKFNHLLTRLTFSILAGNNVARGFKELNPGAGNWALPTTGKYTGVFVKSIKVKSKETGKIVAAYTGAEKSTSQLINFDTYVGTVDDDYSDYVWFNLMGKRNADDPTQLDPLYDGTVIFDGPTPNIETYLDLAPGNADNFAKIIWPQQIDPDLANSVGGALLVSTESSYIMEIELGQYYLDLEDPVDASNNQYKVIYSILKKPIALTSGSFQQGYSYNVMVTLYGIEEIQIKTTLASWQQGDNIEIVGD